MLLHWSSVDCSDSAFVLPFISDFESSILGCPRIRRRVSSLAEVDIAALLVECPGSAVVLPFVPF